MGYKQQSVRYTGKYPVRIFVRSFTRWEDPLYSGMRQWWVGYFLEANGQRWMDFVTVDTWDKAQEAAAALHAHNWFPDLTRFWLTDATLNWEPPQTLPEEIKSLTDETRAHHLAKYAILDDYKYPPRKPGSSLLESFGFVLPESGRISSATPHTSALPSVSSSRDFSNTSTTDTNQITLGATASRPTLEQLEEENRQEDRRASTRRTDVLPELSWKGTLGRAPEAFKNKETGR
jgi:hypothetical protein